MKPVTYISSVESKIHAVKDEDTLFKVWKRDGIYPILSAGDSIMQVSLPIDTYTFSEIITTYPKGSYDSKQLLCKLRKDYPDSKFYTETNNEIQEDRIVKETTFSWVLSREALEAMPFIPYYRETISNLESSNAYLRRKIEEERAGATAAKQHLEQANKELQEIKSLPVWKRVLLWSNYV